MANGIVIIPTYNEIENIERIIRAVFSLHKPFNIHNCAQLADFPLC